MWCYVQVDNLCMQSATASNSAASRHQSSEEFFCLVSPHPSKSVHCLSVSSAMKSCFTTQILKWLCNNHIVGMLMSSQIKRQWILKPVCNGTDYRTGSQRMAVRFWDCEEACTLQSQKCMMHFFMLCFNLRGVYPIEFCIVRLLTISGLIWS